MDREKRLLLERKEEELKQCEADLHSFRVSRDALDKTIAEFYVKKLRIEEEIREAKRMSEKREA